MSDAVGRDDHDNIRRFARSQDGRFAKRVDSVFGPIAAGLVEVYQWGEPKPILVAGGLPSSLRSTLAKHLSGDLDDPLTPLFAETLADLEAEEAANPLLLAGVVHTEPLESCRACSMNPPSRPGRHAHDAAMEAGS